MPTWLLAVLIAYLHFFTVMAEKKKKPGEDELSKKELIVQKLSSESKTTTNFPRNKHYQISLLFEFLTAERD